MSEPLKCDVCGRPDVGVCAYGVMLCSECYLKNPTRWTLPHPDGGSRSLDSTTYRQYHRQHCLRELARAKREVPHD